MKKNFRLIIVADDLTGSGDAGLFFARQKEVPIILYPELKKTKKVSYPVVVIDTESRFSSQREAFRRQILVANFLKKILTENTWLYKKIDSTLRGNIIPETKALLKKLNRNQKIPVIVAFPKQKRYTINNWQYVGNVRLDKTAFARDPKNKIITANVRKLFEKISPDKFLVSNCQNQKQLQKIARILFNQMIKNQIVIGAAGILEEIARIYFTKKISYPFIIPKYQNFSRNILIINGSANPLSHKQLDYLRKKPVRDLGVFTIISAPRKKMHPEILQKNIIRTARKIIQQENITTIIVSGGETAFNLVKSLKLKQLKIIGAIEPGISIIAAEKFRLFLKPGGFGKLDSLQKIVRFIIGRKTNV